jgi:hypothetical protein
MVDAIVIEPTDEMMRQIDREVAGIQFVDCVLRDTQCTGANVVRSTASQIFRRCNTQSRYHRLEFPWD